MAKKYFQKTLSVGLSLALCAGLVAPALAASFNELNAAVNKDAYDESKFEVTQDESGRTVKLLEEVKWQAGDEGSISVEGKKVTIDLNGNDIIANGSGASSAVWVRNGADFTLTDTHEGEDPDGKITNAGKSAVWVGLDSTFTMEGGEISGNHTENGGAADGVTVVNGGHFEMKDGVITDGVFVNDSGSSGKNATKMEMTGGTLLGEVKASEGSEVSISGGTVSSDVDEDLLAEGCVLVDNKDGTYSVADHSDHIWSEWKTTSEAQVGVDGAQERHCQAEGCDAAETQKLPALEPDPVVVPDEPVVTIPDAPVVDIPDEPVIEIDEPAVPLAEGPVTCGEFIDYLWQHEGEPVAKAGTPAVDHEYAAAIRWARSIEIISGDDFDPDELVTVGFVRDILTNFAAYSDLVMPELTTLEGDEDEAVLNCGEVLAEFFGENEAE